MRGKQTIIWSIVIGGIMLRLLPHVPNFAPITGLALFSAVYLKRRWAFLVPLLAVVISDYLLLYFHPFSGQWFDFSRFYSPAALMHDTTPYVWGSFVISGLIGLWLKNHLNPGLTVASTIAASIQFFIITNFGVWLAGGMYPHTAAGLATSYIMGLPFLRWTLLGDLFYTVAFFGLYEMAKRVGKVAKHVTIASS